MSNHPSPRQWIASEGRSNFQGGDGRRWEGSRQDDTGTACGETPQARGMRQARGKGKAGRSGGNVPLVGRWLGLVGPVWRPALPGRGLFLGAEGFFEVVHEVVEGVDGGGVGGLLALHGGDDDVVAELELFEVGVLVGVVGLEALGEEVVEDFVLHGLGVGFLVDDPTGELVGVCGGVFGEFGDLLGGFLDRFPVGVHGVDDVVVVVDAAGDLAVGIGAGGEGEEGEGGCGEGGEDSDVHSGVTLGENEEGARMEWGEGDATVYRAPPGSWSRKRVDDPVVVPPATVWCPSGAGEVEGSLSGELATPVIVGWPSVAGEVAGEPDGWGRSGGRRSRWVRRGRR